MTQTVTVLEIPTDIAVQLQDLAHPVEPPTRNQASQHPSSTDPTVALPTHTVGGRIVLGLDRSVELEDMDITFDMLSFDFEMNGVELVDTEDIDGQLHYECNELAEYSAKLLCREALIASVPSEAALLRPHITYTTSNYSMRYHKDNAITSISEEMFAYLQAEYFEAIVEARVYSLHVVSE